MEKLLNYWSRNSCSVLLLGCYFDKKHISLLDKVSSKSISFLPGIRNNKNYSYDQRLRTLLDISCESFDSLIDSFFIHLNIFYQPISLKDLMITCAITKNYFDVIII